jgi:guanine deaminase
MAPRTDGLQAHRGAILHFRSDPGGSAPDGSFDYIEDGLLLIENGLVAAVGPAQVLLATLPAGSAVVDHGKDILLPGFIDTHIHYPQTDVIGSGGRQLLDWLQDYTFPVESRFADLSHGQEVAEFFLDELVRNGTTTANVFCTVHAASVDAFFAVAKRRRMRMVAGKVLMDRNCPEYLRDTADEGTRQSRELIERWHGDDRLLYAITPRFAPTSSEAQLAGAGQLAAQYPEVFIHSHLAENRDEIAWVKELFPQARSYLDVYDRFGLLRDRAVYAHCIHVEGMDRNRMAQAGAAVAFCPTSNLYLGSGLFDIDAADAARLRFAIATDVGGGSSFSMLRTMGEAYKVAHLGGQHLTALRAFYLSTLGGARALGLEGRIGNFAVGAEADFIALDPCASPLLARRTAQSRTLEEKLQVLMTLGDDRTVRACYILGKQVYGAVSTVRSMQ